jgi:hypothetical protein
MITYLLVGAAALATAVVVTAHATVGLALGISKVKRRSGVKIGPMTYAEFKRRRDRINRKKTGKDKKKKIT